MTKSPDEQLELIESLIREGELKRAERLARELETNENLDVEESLKARIAQLSILVLQRELEKAVKLANIVIDLSEELKLPFFSIDGLLFRAEAQLNLRFLEESQKDLTSTEELLSQLDEEKEIEILQRELQYKMILGDWFSKKYDFEQSLVHYYSAMSINDELNDEYYTVQILDKIARVHFYTGNLELSMQNFQESLSICKKFNYRRIIATINNMIAGIYFKEGNLNESLEQAKQSIRIWEELEDDYNIALGIKNLGFIYDNLGELDKSKEQYERSIDIFEKINRREEIPHLLLNVAHLHQLKGEYDSSLDILKEYYELNEQLQDEKCIGIAHNWIGRVYAIKGELEEALMHFEKSMAIIRKYKLDDMHGEILYNLGELFLKKDEIEKSLENHVQSLEIREKMQIGDNIGKIAFSLKSLTIISLNYGQEQEAYDYLEKLEKLKIETDNVAVNQLYQLTQAILLKYSGSVEEIASAKKILEEIIEEEISEYTITVEAILHLCDSLLLELSSSNELTLLNQAKEYIALLIEIASQQNLYSLLAEVYLLQAQLSLIELKTEEARQFLDKAQNIAESKGLYRLAIRISNEHDALLAKLDLWTDFTMKLPTIAEKLELTHIEEMLDQMVKKRTINIDEEFKEEEVPVSILILNDSGTIMFSKIFSEEIEEQVLDEILLDIKEIVDKKELSSVQRFRFYDFTYLLRKMEPFIFCYMFIGKTYSSINKINSFLASIEDPSPIWDILVSANNASRKISSLNHMAIEKNVQKAFLSSNKK